MGGAFFSYHRFRVSESTDGRAVSGLLVECSSMRGPRPRANLTSNVSFGRILSMVGGTNQKERFWRTRARSVGGLRRLDIAHQRRATPFPRWIRRRLCRLLWHARVARPTCRTGSTILVSALRPDFPDARQSTTLLVLLLPWPGRCLCVS
jgi:hypothetical protein